MKNKRTEEEITGKNSTLSFSKYKEGVSNFYEFSGMSRQLLILRVQAFRKVAQNAAY